MTNPGAFVTNHFLYKTMPFAPADLDVIAVVAKFPNALIVNKDVPVSTVKELIDYARANPGKLNGASAGVGTSGHLSPEVAEDHGRVDIVHVPYQGAAPARFDLAAGRVQVVVDNIPSYVASVTDRSARLLGVGTRERLEDFLTSRRSRKPAACRASRPSSGMRWPLPRERRSRSSTR